MKKDYLRAIKNDMWDVRSSKKWLQLSLKSKLKELEADRKAALDEHFASVEDRESWVSGYFARQINENYDRRRAELISSEYEAYHNNQTYQLIYKDGREVVISAEDILSGEPFPKMSDIVYAYLMSADDEMDTETGDLDFYSDERLKACDYDYEAEDDRRWQYETAIQFKFGTEWAEKYHRAHPEFVPAAI